LLLVHWLMGTHHIYHFIMRDIGVALCRIYRLFVTTVSQLKTCDFSGETFQDFKALLSVNECKDDTTALQRLVLQTAMTLYLLKVHLQTFLSIPITQKCQILRCDTIITNEQYVHTYLIQ